MVIWFWEHQGKLEVLVLYSNCFLAHLKEFYFVLICISCSWYGLYVLYAMCLHVLMCCCCYSPAKVMSKHLQWTLLYVLGRMNH